MHNSKIIPFITGIMLYSVVLGYYINRFFSEIDFLFDIQNSYVNIIMLFLLIMLLLVFSGALFILSLSKNDRWLYTALSCFGFILGYLSAGFNFDKLINACVLAVIFGVALFNFDTDLNDKYRNMIKPNFTTSITDASGTFLFFFSILISVNFYLFNNSSLQRNLIVERSITLAVDPVAQISEQSAINLISRFSPELTKGLGTPDEIKNGMINGQTGKVKEDLKSAFANDLRPYTALILNIISLAIFFTLFSVFKIIKTLMWPLGYGLFYFLMKTGYIKEEKESAEIIRFKF